MNGRAFQGTRLATRDIGL
jgi:hypothetical protein